MISDLHFDPMSDPKLVDRLAAAEPAGWPPVLESAANARPSQYGKDSNWPLLHSALEQMRKTLPSPAFVLVPGDFLAHNFRREFDALAADHSDAAYRSFVREMMEFLALQIE
jgi:sphingomyelin phosphodiesterase acid-like 3